MVDIAKQTTFRIKRAESLISELIDTYNDNKLSEKASEATAAILSRSFLVSIGVMK